MRAFAAGQRLVAGTWGIAEPAPEAAEVFPDILLVPLLAFNHSGQRIGYGAGYSDLTIAGLRARARPSPPAAWASPVQEKFQACRRRRATRASISPKRARGHRLPGRVTDVHPVHRRRRGAQRARKILLERLGSSWPTWKFDFMLVNGENAAGGFGVCEEHLAGIRRCRRRRDHRRQPLLGPERGARFRWTPPPRLLRPIDSPASTPRPRGGADRREEDGTRVLRARQRHGPRPSTLDDPFAAVERELAACPLKQAADTTVVDIHGEATSGKQAIGHFCDGRASLVVGTHAHVRARPPELLGAPAPSSPTWAWPGGSIS